MIEGTLPTLEQVNAMLSDGIALRTNALKYCRKEDINRVPVSDPVDEMITRLLAQPKEERTLLKDFYQRANPRILGINTRASLAASYIARSFVPMTIKGAYFDYDSALVQADENKARELLTNTVAQFDYGMGMFSSVSFLAEKTPRLTRAEFEASVLKQFKGVFDRINATMPADVEQQAAKLADDHQRVLHLAEHDPTGYSVVDYFSAANTPESSPLLAAYSPPFFKGSADSAKLYKVLYLCTEGILSEST